MSFLKDAMDSQKDSPDSVAETEQSIFAQRHESLANGFNELCDANGVKCSLLFVSDPDTSTPIVLGRGPMYEIAKGLAAILRSMKTELLEELEA